MVAATQPQQHPSTAADSTTTANANVTSVEDEALKRNIDCVYFLASPLTCKKGAGQLYMHHLRPFLLRHQARLDCFVEFLSGEMNKFVSAHQAEFQFAKALLMKILASVNQIARDVIRPGDRQANDTFQGLARRIQDSQSDGED